MAISTIGANSLAQSRILTAVQQPAGAVLQVLQAFKPNSFSTTSASYVDITGLSVSITPSSASNTILVLASVMVSNGGNAQLSLVRNSTLIAQSTSGTANETVAMTYPTSYMSYTYPIMYLDSPSTTSAINYKIQVRSDGSGTAYINLRANDQYYGSISTITVMEIAA